MNKTTPTTLPTLLCDLAPIWRVYENPKPVPRWSKYLEKIPGLPVQTSSSHTGSFLAVAFPVLTLLKEHANYDVFLLAHAIKLHDMPEWVRGIDVSRLEKTEGDDLAEYMAFYEAHKGVSEKIFKIQERAYLLQYAHLFPASFPERAKRIMGELWKNNRLDCLLFPALELFEYAYYGHFVFEKYGQPIVLKHVLETTLFELNKYAATLPGFGEEVITPEYTAWAYKFNYDHRHLPKHEKFFQKEEKPEEEKTEEEKITG